MANGYLVERIGTGLREASRDVLEEQLPERWRNLIERLAELEQHHEHSTWPGQSRRWEPPG